MQTIYITTAIIILFRADHKQDYTGSVRKCCWSASNSLNAIMYNGSQLPTKHQNKRKRYADDNEKYRLKFFTRMAIQSLWNKQTTCIESDLQAITSGPRVASEDDPSYTHPPGRSTKALIECPLHVGPWFPTFLHLCMGRVYYRKGGACSQHPTNPNQVLWMTYMCIHNALW